MDNNDSNKLQQTGGLKLMTVFIAVLALHVIVIGGFTVYHLMSGGGTDADIVSLDKLHKSGDVTTTTTPDASQPDKTTTSAPTPTDVATTTPAPAPTPAPETTTGATPAPAPDTSVANDTVAPAPAPAPVLTPVPSPAPTPLVTNPAPLTLAPSNAYANNPALSPLAPSADGSQPQPAPTPLGPVPSLTGPVHMPPASAAPSPSHMEGQIYTVKITDSYKKIAKAHHVTVAQLKEANHIKGDVLHTGQKLVIPSARTMVAKSESKLEAKPEPSPLDAAPSASVLSQAPVVRTAVLTSTTTEVRSHEHTYTIVKGDTLSKIARRFKTTSAALMSENNITDPTRLTIGKKLRIPSRESRSASITPAPAPVEPSEVKTETPQPVETIRPTPTVAPSNQDVPASGDLATFTP